MTYSREQIIVTIATDGAVVATTHGIKGTGCLDYINLLEDLLEAEATTSNYTPEYNETAQSRHDEVDNDQRQH